MPSTPESCAAEPVLEEYDFEESVGYWLVLAARALQKSLSEELAPHGVTYRQAQVLGWLALEGELSQVALAERMMIEPATLVGVLNRMERDELICRVTSPFDRRRKIVRVSDRAGEIWSKVIVCARRVRGRAVKGLSDRQVKTLRRTLHVVLGNLEAAADESQP